MATYRVRSDACSTWEASTSYIAGDRVVSTWSAAGYAKGKVYRCSVGGQSGGSEPTWDYDLAHSTEDNEVTWITESSADGTWDNATNSLLRVVGLGVYSPIDAGDTVLVADDHDEEYTLGNITLNGGSVSSKVDILCVDISDDSLSTGAVVSVTDILVGWQYAYSYGVTYKCGTFRIYGDNAWTLSGGTVIQITGTGSVSIQGGVYGTLRVINGDIQFDNIGGDIDFSNGYFARFFWENGTLIAPSGCSSLIDIDENPQEIIIRNVDLSQCGDGSNKRSLVRGDRVFHKIIFDRCKLPDPAVATGFAIVGPSDTYPNLDRRSRVELYQCSHTNIRQKVQVEDYFGTITTDLDVYRTGGADDGVNSFSLKMAQNNLEGTGPFYMGKEFNINPITTWTDSTSEVAFIIEGVLDSATNLQNDEIWMELHYPVNNTDGLGGHVSTKIESPLSTPSDVESSSSIWTGTGGFSNENTFKLSVTVTPGRAGPVTAYVCLAKPSTTVYIDPIVTEI